MICYYTTRFYLMFVAGTLLLVPQIAGACAVCFGGPDSPPSKGLTVAVLFLVGVIVMVLAGVALFAVSMLRRNRQHEHGSHEAPFIGGTDG